MRVLHVSQGATYGLATYLSQLVSDQIARGWDVALATPHVAELEELCTRAGARHCVWPARRTPGPSVIAEARRLRKIVNETDPEVVHLHSSKAGLVGRLAIRKRRPTVFTPHAWSFLHEGLMMRAASIRWERWAARWTHVTLCVSHSERELGARAGITTHWEVVPNAVDLSRFPRADERERREIRGALGLSARAPAVVCVGRLVPQKGQDVLLRAWSAVAAAHPDATLTFVGDGPERESLERAAPAPGVRFVGEQDDVRPWLVAADVVVLPSRWEGLSLVFLEALASGSSIVATDVSGARETLTESGADAAAIVPCEDERALASAIITRLDDPRLVARERARARAIAAAHSLDQWGAEIARVLTEVAASPTRRRITPGLT